MHRALANPRYECTEAGADSVFIATLANATEQSHLNSVFTQESPDLTGKLNLPHFFVDAADVVCGVQSQVVFGEEMSSAHKTSIGLMFVVSPQESGTAVESHVPSRGESQELCVIIE